VIYYPILSQYILLFGSSSYVVDDEGFSVFVEFVGAYAYMV
jgi:hypothetical protein